MKAEFAKLKKQKDKLMKLARKQEDLRAEVLRKQREELKLKREIRMLREETGKGIRGAIKKYQRVRDSPKAKHYVRQAKSIGGSIQRFINRHGTK